MKRSVKAVGKRPQKHALPIEDLKKWYFDQFNKQGYPPSINQLEKKFGVSEETVTQKIRVLNKKGKISFRVGLLEDKKTVRLSPNEYSAFLFAQKYLQKTGKKADLTAVEKNLGFRRVENILGRLKKKIGSREFYKLFLHSK